MKSELLAQSAAFLLFSVLLAILLGMTVRFEVSRLILTIALAGFCLLAELYVLVKILRRIWKWSGVITGVLFRSESNSPIDRQAAKAR